MYQGTFEHGQIIEAFQRCVPGTYVRDYRETGGYITICKGYKDIPWRDQTTTRNVEVQVPDKTLASLPRGNVTAATRYNGLRLDRPGWREQFRKSMRHLSRDQMKAITRFLGAGEVFPGVV
jgi:hypothetical protein